MKTAVIAAFSIGMALAVFAVPAEVDVSRVVVVDGAEPPLVADLKKHLDLLTGRDVPVVSPEKIEKGQFGFYLGYRPLRIENPAEKRPGLVEWQVDDDGVRIWGELRRGLYRFLLEEFDFEWPWADEIWVRQQTNTLVFSESAGSWYPPFRIRWIRPQKYETFINWLPRLQAGRDDAPPEGHAFTTWWFRFCDSHPEYFGMRPDGLRAPFGVSERDLENALKVPKKAAEQIALCPSCDGLAYEIVENWRKQGAGSSINLCENDARPWQFCHCKECIALDGDPVDCFAGVKVGDGTYAGWRSDRYLYLCRKVLEKAAAVNPEVKGGMYAYNVSELPPQRERVPANLVVGLVPTTFSKEYVAAYVDGWKKAGLVEFYYRPNIRLYWRVPFMPMGYEKYLFEVQDLLYSRGGCIGFTYDGNAATSYFEYVQCWYLLKFMTDPTKSFTYWEKRFCRCFGSAAPEVGEYFAFWRKRWKDRIEPLLGELGGIGFNDRFNGRLAEFYCEDDWSKTSAILDKGLARTDLGKIERRLLQTLRDENEQSLLSYRAWTQRSKEAVDALLDFRRSHGRATIWGFEEAVFGKQEW